nr:PREDICTED: phospholipase B1, membrane-associated [Latimeria chalumnae]|eukprot:XP_014343309.1 PREDICTED: phospholipase B1, membrane-associated [Latimeria chalumnae]
MRLALQAAWFTHNTKYEQLSERSGKDVVERSTVALTDIVRRFNPSVIGLPGNQLDSAWSEAVPETHEEDLFSQTRTLIDAMKSTKLVDFQNDWKVITVFVGAEELCFDCATEDNFSPSSFRKRLTKVLDHLQQEVPRAFVNLVDSTYHRDLLSFPQDSANETRKLCPCSYKLPGSSLELFEAEAAAAASWKLPQLVASWAYQEEVEQLVVSGRYDTQDDFTVVIQPFLRSTKLPSVQESEAALSNAPSKDFDEAGHGYRELGLGIWNNMLEPVGQKTELYDLGKQLEARCPSQDQPYLFTYRNGNHRTKTNLSEPSNERLQVRAFGSQVTCTERDPSASVPISVHALRPADIKVIAAVGDSLTAEAQERGEWDLDGPPIGSSSAVHADADIIRKFNPLLVGFSTGTGNQHTPQSFLNQAVPGKKAEDMQGQVRRVLELMRNNTPIFEITEDPRNNVPRCSESRKINFQEDWKLLTFFIGGNDLCDYCENKTWYSPTNFINRIQKALDILHKEAPRMFVNLVMVLDILPLREVYQDMTVRCPRFLMRALCPCVLLPDDNSAEYEELQLMNLQYQEKTQLLIDTGRYDTKEDFTVVMQPLLQQLVMPRTPGGRPDSSYFAPDCFHFNVKTHSQAARSLWNNMLEPLGEKTNNQSLDIIPPLECPSQEQPFLRTYRNSNYTYPNISTTAMPVLTTAVQTTAQKPDLGYGSHLQCEDRSPSNVVPTSVHALRPADIRVVAALGDSITHRRGQITEHSDNFANEVPAQVRILVDRMKNNSRIDFLNDWKVITLFIGGNDLCDYCTDTNFLSAQRYTSQLQKALDLLHKEVSERYCMV